MNSCNNCGNCNQCCDPCDPCKQSCTARYDCQFNIEVSPYDPTTWVVTIGGMTYKVKVPECNETDTTLATDYDGATLRYKAEKHTDVIPGANIGNIINLDELRNVEIDDGLNGHCYELIFRKFAECGDGCRSAFDKWENFNINSDGALQNGIKYVRGANAYGCPVYLDVPTDTTTYWWGMWRPNDTGTGLEFGYIQPEEVDTLPTDENGNIIVISQKADGQPVVGKLVQPSNLIYDFTTRPGDPTDLNRYFVANSVSSVDIVCTPEGNSSWRAPVDGFMIINYCVNAINQGAGLFEVDVTPVLDNQSWSQSAQNNNSSHTNWDFSGDSDPRNSSEGVSRTIVIPKGRTAKLCARVLLGGSMAGQWRVHSIHCTFVPTAYQVL